MLKEKEAGRHKGIWEKSNLNTRGMMEKKFLK